MSSRFGHTWTVKMTLTTINFSENQKLAFFSERMSKEKFHAKREFVSKGLGKPVSKEQINEANDAREGFPSHNIWSQSYTKVLPQQKSSLIRKYKYFAFCCNTLRYGFIGSNRVQYP